MPMDKSGKFRLNSQAVSHADRMSEGRGKEPMPKAEGEHESGGEHTELHDHGDGTYHSMIGGEKTEHPHIGHAVTHIAAHHEPSGTHHHAHSDGMGVTSHHANDGGEVEGPHEHETPEEAADHMTQAMSGGDGETSNHEESDGNGGVGMAGLHSLMKM